MALTDRQRRYYASAPAGEVQQHCLSLFHSEFSHAHHLTTWTRPFSAYVRGVLVDFIFHPFTVDLPARNGNGQQDLEISAFIGDDAFIAEMQAATLTATTPIIVEYNRYFPDDPAAQDAPISLSASSLSISGATVSLRASRADLLNRSFPRELFRPAAWPGLVR